MRKRAAPLLPCAISRGAASQPARCLSAGGSSAALSQPLNSTRTLCWSAGSRAGGEGAARMFQILPAHYTPQIAAFLSTSPSHLPCARSHKPCLASPTPLPPSDVPMCASVCVCRVACLQGEPHVGWPEGIAGGGRGILAYSCSSRS